MCNISFIPYIVLIRIPPWSFQNINWKIVKYHCLRLYCVNFKESVSKTKTLINSDQAKNHLLKRYGSLIFSDLQFILALFCSLVIDKFSLVLSLFLIVSTLKKGINTLRRIEGINRNKEKTFINIITIDGKL